MSVAQRTLYVRCRNCGAEGRAFDLLSDWDTAAYVFKCCGHRAHLDESEGGAHSWVAEPGRAVETETEQ